MCDEMTYEELVYELDFYYEQERIKAEEAEK